MKMIFFASGETTIFPGFLILLTLHAVAIWTAIAAFTGKKNIGLITCASVVTLLGGFQVVQMITGIGVVYRENVMILIRAFAFSGAPMLMGTISLSKLPLSRSKTRPDVDKRRIAEK